MSLGHSPRIVTDGLVFNVDAANSKSATNISRNLLTFPEDFSNAIWLTSNPPSVTANYTMAPDGTMTADRLYFPFGTNPRVFQTTSLPLGQVVTFSMWIKSNTPSSQGIVLYFREQNFGTTWASANHTATTEWQRFSITFTVPTSGSSGNIMSLLYQSGSTTIWDISAWGAQLEYGSVATDYYPLSSNIASTTWKDISGYGNDGTLVNNPIYSPEQGGCIIFNNINNYVNIPQNSTINLASTFTASVWVKITNLTDSHEIISKGAGLNSNGPYGWALSYYNVTNTIYFDTYSTSTRYALVAAFNTTAWKNITVTFNNGTKFIYVDGVQLATATAAHTIGDTSYDFRISESSTWPALAGNVSCVTLYNRALSAAEVQQNFNSLRARYGI